MFPYIGSKYIEHRLSKCSHIELRALQYKFKISDAEKKKIKTQKGLMNCLVLGYKNITNDTDLKNTIIEPLVASIERGVRFIPETPNLGPSEEVLKFSNTIRLICPDFLDYSTRISIWYLLKKFDFDNDRNNYFRQRRKFNVNVVVSPVTDINMEFDCPICYQDELNIISSVKMNCGHAYCSGCMENYLEIKSKETRAQVVICCGMCREVIKEVSFKDGEKAEIIKNKYFH